MKYRLPEPAEAREHVGTENTPYELVHYHSDPRAIKIRSQINSWLSAWPSDNWRRIEARLLNNDSDFMSCLWELYVSSFLQTLNFNVDVIPEVEGESRPDFLVSNGDFEFIVEASTVQLSKSDQLRKQNLRKIVDSLNTFGDKDFTIALTVLRCDSSQIKNSHLAHVINDWLRNVDAQSEDLTKEFVVKNWAFEVNALRRENRNWPFIYMWNDVSISSLVGDEGFANKLESKASKYKTFMPKLSRILFIANTKYFIGDYEWQINNVLFGSEQITINTLNGETKQTRAKNGLAYRHGTRLNRDLDGILATPFFDLHEPPSMTFTYWQLPNSLRVAKPEFPFPTWRLDGEFFSRFNPNGVPESD